MVEDTDGRRGLLLIVGAAFCFSLMSVQVKLAGRILPVEMLILARGLVTLVLSYALLRHGRIPIWGNNKKVLILRGVFGVSALACFFYAVTVLPLAEVTVIHYLNPVLTAAIAAMFIGERVDGRLAAAIALSLTGTLLVARPGFDHGGAPLPTAGVVAAFTGALLSACAYVAVRKASRSDHPYVIVFYFPVVATPVVLPFALRAWVWPTATGWLLLLGIGVTVQVAQILLTRGLALVPAGRGTTIGYVQIVFAALWGLLLFGETPSGWTLAGAGLIVVSTASLLRRRLDPAVAPPAAT